MGPARFHCAWQSQEAVGSNEDCLKMVKKRKLLQEIEDEISKRIKIVQLQNLGAPTEVTMDGDETLVKSSKWLK